MDYTLRPAPNALETHRLELPARDAYIYDVDAHDKAIGELTPLSVILDPLRAGRIFARDSLYMCRALGWNVHISNDLPHSLKVIPNGNAAPTLLVKDSDRPMVSNIVVAALFYAWAGRAAGLWTCCPDASQYTRTVPLHHNKVRFSPRAMVTNGLPGQDVDGTCLNHWYESMVFSRLFFHAWNIFSTNMVDTLMARDELEPALQPFLDQCMNNKYVSHLNITKDSDWRETYQISHKRFIFLTEEDYAPIRKILTRQGWE